MSTEHAVCRVVACLGRDTDSELGGGLRGVAPSEAVSPKMGIRARPCSRAVAAHPFPFLLSAEPRSYVESVARTATTGRGGTLPAAQPGGLEVPTRNGAFGNSFTAPSPVSTSSPIHSVDG